MDKTDLSEKPTGGRVLRAADVIPPFDKDGSQPGPGGPPQLVPSAGGAGGTRAKGRSARGVKPAGEVVGRAPRPPFDDRGIPAYDLAENILAEQRQVAAQRRRRPGKTGDGPVAAFVAPSAAAGPKTFVGAPSPREVLELQRVVAEIVARDIERLCRRPGRQPCAYP